MNRFLLKEKLKTRCFGPTLEEACSELRKRKFFLVTGIGRSGTTFLAKLLNESTNGMVMHEPVRKEAFEYRVACDSQKKARSYVRKFRLPYIVYRLVDNENSRYGEVNSMLRRHIRWIKEAMGEMPILHLVRDGRDVVSSAMNRDTFTVKNLIDECFYIPNDSITRDEFISLPKFEKVCWYWRLENEALVNLLDLRVRLEDITESYEAFDHGVCSPLSLSVSKQDWERHRGKKINVSKEYLYSSVDDWKSDEKAAFDRICGDIMGEFGYGE